MAAVQKSDLRTRIRTVTRQGNTSGFISDDEINSLIAEGATELYDLLIRARGADYYSTIDVFNTTAGTADTDYDLPADFYRLEALAISETAGTGSGPTTAPVGAQWHEPRRFRAADLAVQSSLRPTHPLDLRYALTGSQSQSIEVQGNAKIRFYPAPEHEWCVRIVYLPTIYADGEADAYDAINGWESYIVYRAAAIIAAMQEEDPGAWLMQQSAMRERIAALAPSRDRAVPTQVADRRGAVRSGRLRWPERLPRP